MRAEVRSSPHTHMSLKFLARSESRSASCPTKSAFAEGARLFRRCAKTEWRG